MLRVRSEDVINSLLIAVRTHGLLLPGALAPGSGEFVGR